MRYEGTVYRPPSEARSLIIQATIGCSHNTCRFCDMYKQKRFHIRPLPDILADLAEARTFLPQVRRIFLADGDALIMAMDQLAAILTTIRDLFPECERVTCYASPQSLLLKTPEDLRALRELGLVMVYLGLESGDDGVLAAVDKGFTASQIVEAGQKAKTAGLALSVTAISGLGGLPHWEDHAIHTGEALSAMKADYVGLLTLYLEPGVPMREDLDAGRFQPFSPLQTAAETRLLLTHLDSEGTVFRANHASNYLNLAGTLNRDKAALLAKLDRALEGQVPFRNEGMRGL